MRRICLRYYLLAIATAANVFASTAQELDLSGKWQCKLGGDGTTAPAKQEFQQTIQLPGSLAERGLGEDPAMDSPWTGSIRREEWNKARYEPYKTEDNFKMPFWLQPA